LPKTQWPLGDRDYDADWFRDALRKKALSHPFQAENRATNR